MGILVGRAQLFSYLKFRSFCQKAAKLPAKDALHITNSLFADCIYVYLDCIYVYLD